MIVRRGEIYWIDFGIPRGSEQSGRRPALIIQNDIGNANSPTTIIAAITSKKKEAYPFHVEISALESGLPQDSIVLLNQLLTVSKERLISRAGNLSSVKMKDVDRALQVSLGFSSSEKSEEVISPDETEELPKLETKSDATDGSVA